MFRTSFEFSTLGDELISRIASTFVLTMLLAQAGIAQKYTITDLGLLPGGTFSEGLGIDQSGQVTGDADGNFVIHAFLYSNGRMLDLGTLPGQSSRSRSFGRGIVRRTRKSDRDDERRDRRRGLDVYVTGYAEVGPFSYDHAFLYSDGKMLDLGTLAGGEFSMSQGYGVNESGEVVGASSVTPFGNEHAFLYSDGKMRDLGTLEAFPGNSTATAINRSGEVTGFSSTNFGPHAFLYSDGQMSDLGTLPGGSSFGQAINENGQVAGASTTTTFPGDFHAFLYSDGEMRDLGTLPEGGDAFGLGINRSGEVVGSAGIIAHSRFPSHAFLYRNGKMLDLNSLIPPNSGWLLLEATAINDRGQITGWGTLNGSFDRGFLLTPVCSENEGNDREEHCEDE